MPPKAAWPQHIDPSAKPLERKSYWAVKGRPDASRHTFALWTYSDRAV